VLVVYVKGVYLAGGKKLVLQHVRVVELVLKHMNVHVTLMVAVEVILFVLGHGLE
jgi:hypothetical protein